MATVSEKKTYIDWATFVTDLKTAYDWANSEIDEINGTASFYDASGNYIIVTWASNSIVIAPYTSRGIGGDHAISGPYVWFITTSKTFSIWASTASGNGLSAYQTKGLIFTDAEGDNVIIYKEGASSKVSTAMFDGTCVELKKSSRSYECMQSAYKAVAVPICCQTSSLLCDNALVLINNPLPALSHSAVTLDGKNYYMIGLLLLADD